jgi:hypothetical protein
VITREREPLAGVAATRRRRPAALELLARMVTWGARLDRDLRAHGHSGLAAAGEARAVASDANLTRIV